MVKTKNKKKKQFSDYPSHRALRDKHVFYSGQYEHLSDKEQSEILKSVKQVYGNTETMLTAMKNNYEIMDITNDINTLIGYYLLNKLIMDTKHKIPFGTEEYSVCFASNEDLVLCDYRNFSKRSDGFKRMQMLIFPPTRNSGKKDGLYKVSVTRHIRDGKHKVTRKEEYVLRAKDNKKYLMREFKHKIMSRKLLPTAYYGYIGKNPKEYLSSIVDLDSRSIKNIGKFENLFK